MLKDCNLIFDGFTGFTPVQVNLLKTLFPMTDRVWAAVTLDKKGRPFLCDRNTGTFPYEPENGQNAVRTCR